MPKVEPPVIVLEGNETWVIATFAPDALEVTQPSAEVNNQTKGLKKTTQNGEKVGNNESQKSVEFPSPTFEPKKTSGEECVQCTPGSSGWPWLGSDYEDKEKENAPADYTQNDV